MRRTKKILRGFSIVELLVVLVIFSVLAILVTQSLALTLTGSRKSESQISVRENLDLVFAVMERQIRNADSIVTCPLPDTNVLNYIDEYGAATSFSCDAVDGFIASGSARLTNDDVLVTCSGIFECDQGVGNVPPSVTITVTAVASDSQGAEGAQISTSTKILLRSY